MCSQTASPTSAPLRQRLFQPLLDLVSGAKHFRSCHSLPDDDWAVLCARRVIECQHSGRAFLEFAADKLGNDVDHRLFFESLKSERRLLFCRELAHGIKRHLSTLTPGRDPFCDTAALDGYDIYSGDGHYVMSSMRAGIKPLMEPNMRQAISTDWTSAPMPSFI